MRAKQARKTARKAVRKPKKRTPAKRRPRHFDKPDPFYLDPALIPARWAYQWMPSIDPSSHWRAVPYSRHAHDFPTAARTSDGGIEIKGLVLAETQATNVMAELELVRKKSKNQMGDLAEEMGKKDGQGFWIAPPSWNASYTSAELREMAPPAEVGPPITIEVQMWVKVPARWASAAAYLKLPLQEYARRRIVMERMVLGCMDPFSERAVHEPVNIFVSPSKEV